MSILRTFCPGLAALLLILIVPSSAFAASGVIALFTDYGWEDPYVAQLKGVILTVNPSARILDLTHSVTQFNIVEGSYLLEQSAEEFPAGTIFVAVIDPGVGTDRGPVLLQTGRGKFFLGPDNGLFSDVIAHEGVAKVWKLDQAQYFRPGSVSHTFHGRDIFAPVAAHLSNGVDPERLGTPLNHVLLLPLKEPTVSGALVSTQVLHVDHYGNVVLNLRSDSEIAAKFKQGTLVKISIGKENFSAPLVNTYGDVDKGRLVLLYGGSGLLEIGQNQGSAAKQLKVAPGAVIFLKP